MAVDRRVEGSAWAARSPGLAEESDRLLGALPVLLDEAGERGRRILATSPGAGPSVLRIARLVAMAAPELAPVLPRRDPDAVVTALARLALRGGPTYVKLGQLVASTRGLAPTWIADAFAGCRDAVPPAPVEAIEAVLAGTGVLGQLRSWNGIPMASASVAQVHEATLVGGTEVVLKVRRPGVVATVAADASYLLPALRFLEGRNERLRVANLSGAVDLMVRLFAQEADLRLEAANTVEMALAFERAGHRLVVPAPIPGMVTKRVVALEYVDGVSGADVAGVSRFGHHAEDLVRLAITGTLTTTLVDGIFHGDLHLGNVLVTGAGLALIDFGIVGRLDASQRRALVSLLVGALAEDRSAVIAALRDFGAVPAGTDLSELQSRLPPPLTPAERRALVADGGRRAVAERVSAVVRALAAAGFRVPPELTLFVKNVMYLADAVHRHAPHVDLAGELAAAVAAIPPDLT